MFKFEKPQSNYLASNFKCGEVFCLKAQSYNIKCDFCGERVAFEEFAKHFNELHWPQGDYPPVIDNISMNKSCGDCEYQGYSESHNQIEDIDEKPITFMDLVTSHVETFVETLNSSVAKKSPQADLGDSNPASVDGKDGDVGGVLEYESNSEVMPNEEQATRVQCSLCKKIYAHKDSLRKHLRHVHQKIKRDARSKCMLNAKPESKTKQEPTLYKCDECDEEFRLVASLRKHKFFHTGIICDICGKSFTQVGNMLVHKRRHDAAKPFKCQECPYSSKTSQELKAHMTCHNPEPVICEQCGVTIRDRYKMTAHMKRHNNDRPAKCDVCGKRFFSNNDLRIHSATHTNERPFQCGICGSKFRIKKSLRVHQKVHMKGIPKEFVCQVCSKAFYLEKGLMAHLRTHDPEYKTLLMLASTSNS